MRLLICTGIFPPEIGGPATYSRILAEELTERGHEVRVITYFSPSGGSPAGGQFPIIRIQRSQFKLWHYYQYFRAVKKLGLEADLIYAQDPVSAGYPSYLAAKILKKPLVVKITGDYSWEQAMGRGYTDRLIDDFQSLKNLRPKIRRIRDIQIRVCKDAALVITPSEYLKKIVVGWGIPEEKIKVIYNAVSIPKLMGLKKNANEFLIVTSGRTVPWKGFEALRETVSALSNSIELDSRRIRLEILQNMPRAEMFSRLAVADLYVLNTGYEGFAHAIVEAMGVGVPVVTTNVCGNPEIVEHMQTGLLVEYNDTNQLRSAILQLYQDPALRMRLSQNASRNLEKFSLSNMIAKTESVLKSLIPDS